MGVEREDLENKNGWLESDEKRRVFAFLVLESSEESAIGVDEGLEGDIMESDS